jgi:hypothetical protein
VISIIVVVKTSTNVVVKRQTAKRLLRWSEYSVFAYKIAALFINNNYHYYIILLY